MSRMLQRWCEKEEGGRNGMSSTVLALIACSRHGLSYAELCALSGGTGAAAALLPFVYYPCIMPLHARSATLFNNPNRIAVAATPSFRGGVKASLSPGRDSLSTAQ